MEPIDSLKKIVSPENITTEQFDRIAYSCEHGAVMGPFLPDKSIVSIAIVRPNSAEQVSDILKLANEKLFPVLVRTKGTGMRVGIRPTKPGMVIMDLSRIGGIELFEDNGYVEVGPAVTTTQLNETLAPKYYFPMFPGSYRISSIAGIISTNTSGHIVDSYQGKPGRYVMGLEVVLPTGEIIYTGTRTLRGHAGVDLTRLFIGGTGLFGVITKIRLRLLRKPLEEAYSWIIFESVKDIVKASIRVLREGVYPRIFELMSENITESLFKIIGEEAPPGAVLIIITDGYTPGEADWKMDKIVEICKRDKVLAVRRFDEYSDWVPLWYAREYGGPIAPIEAVKAKLWDADVLDFQLVNAESLTKEAISLLETYRSQYGVDAWIIGHIGGAMVHPVYSFPVDMDLKEVEKLKEKIRDDMTQLRLKYGGSMGEQGLFPNYVDWFRAAYGDDYYDAIKRIKKALDPNDILMPGRL